MFCADTFSTDSALLKTAAKNCDVLALARFEKISYLHLQIFGKKIYELTFQNLNSKKSLLVIFQGI